MTASHHAVEKRERNLNIIQLMLEADVDVNSRAEQLCNMPALYSVTKRGCTVVTKALLEAGADPDESGHGEQFLFHPAFSGKTVSLECLLNREIIDKTAGLMLHFAASYKHFEVVRLLLQTLDGICEMRKK